MDHRSREHDKIESKIFSTFLDLSASTITQEHEIGLEHTLGTCQVDDLDSRT